MEIGFILSQALLFILVYMIIMFIIASIKKNNGIVDIGWGLGFVLLSWLVMFGTHSTETRQIVVTLLTFIWGLRLSVHIFMRSRGKGEDYRYAQWRKDWGDYVLLNSFFKVFILQGVLLFIISLPLIFIGVDQRIGFNALDIFALLLWIFGFAFESIGDFQVHQFKQNPANKGRIYTGGLWKYTRHPNYFGEFVMWLAIWIFSLSTSYGLIAIISPALLLFLLLRVSGVPLLEKKYEGNAEFEAYKKKTPAFFPRFRK